MTSAPPLPFEPFALMRDWELDLLQAASPVFDGLGQVATEVHDMQLVGPNQQPVPTGLVAQLIQNMVENNNFPTTIDMDKLPGDVSVDSFFDITATLSVRPDGLHLVTFHTLQDDFEDGPMFLNLGSIVLDVPNPAGIALLPAEAAPSGGSTFSTSQAFAIPLYVLVGDPGPGGYEIVLYNVTGFDDPSLVDVPEQPSLPARIALAQSLPNPMRHQTNISSFSLPTPAPRAHLALYDVRGRRVRTLVDDSLPAGTHKMAWDGRTDSGVQAAAGVYFYRLEVQNSAGKELLTKRLVLIP